MCSKMFILNFIAGVMMVGTVLARPEPLPMFLFNRAIKASGADIQVDIEKINEDLPITKDNTPADLRVDQISGFEIAQAENSQSFVNQDVPAAAETAIDNLPAASKLEDISDSETEMKNDDTKSSPADTDVIALEIPSANESSPDLVVEDNNGNAKFYQGKTRKVYKKKQQKYTGTTHPVKYYKTLKLHRMAKLDSLIEVLLDSLMFANEDFEDNRNIYVDPFDYFTPFDYFN